MQLTEPFSCKRAKINAKPNYIIRIPLEFKPLLPGDFEDKVLIRVDSTGCTLSCVIRAKCKSN
jgi:hypothetical protein